ncbi:MAG: hypothetical protein KatS3mg011_1238 [Acidimicrobiia bacterium]|nr:MAG: hypothetical protein KatS3mg011_1238 [Acidimicrobiia bacterium]
MRPHFGAVILGTAFALFGVATLGHQAGWWTLELRLVWPSVLVVLGLVVLAGSHRRQP